MSIFPLPVFEADADPHHRSAMSDEEIYSRLEAPKTIVIRFGHLKHVAEYPYDGDAKPGCGSKLVARTHRGTEVVEMLTTTCGNSGCGKSVSRREMLDYIDNSGGKEYPFHSKGRILRVAGIEDLNQQSALESVRREATRIAKALVAELALPMKIVEAEPILGGECLTFYYMSEQRIDFRDLVQRLASHFAARIEMRQVGARDEARLVADYERCGQHCCCKNFLKVLKPVSMRQAKVQKATLDPLKISGRCGRLMCCLRYEDQTYKELKGRLPHRNTRVGTSEGPGVVVDSKILVQLVLVRLEHDMREIAVPVEELMDPDKCPPPKPAGEPEMRGRSERPRGAAPSQATQAGRAPKPPRPEASSPPTARATPSPPRVSAPTPGPDDPLRGMNAGEAAERSDDAQRQRKKRRRRRKRGGGGEASARDGAPRGEQTTPSKPTRAQQQDAYRRMAQEHDAAPDADADGDANNTPAEQAPGGAAPSEPGQRKRRRRRRRRRNGGNGGENPHGAGDPPAPSM